VCWVCFVGVENEGYCVGVGNRCSVGRWEVWGACSRKGAKSSWAGNA